jgi:hypothetical protein
MGKGKASVRWQCLMVTTWQNRGAHAVFSPTDKRRDSKKHIDGTMGHGDRPAQNHES